MLIVVVLAYPQLFNKKITSIIAYESMDQSWYGWIIEVDEWIYVSLFSFGSLL